MQQQLQGSIATIAQIYSTKQAQKQTSTSTAEVTPETLAEAFAFAFPSIPGKQKLDFKSVLQLSNVIEREGLQSQQTQHPLDQLIEPPKP